MFETLMYIGCKQITYILNNEQFPCLYCFVQDLFNIINVK